MSPGQQLREILISEEKIDKEREMGFLKSTRGMMWRVWMILHFSLSLSPSLPSFEIDFAFWHSRARELGECVLCVCVVAENEYYYYAWFLMLFVFVTLWGQPHTLCERLDYCNLLLPNMILVCFKNLYHLPCMWYDAFVGAIQNRPNTSFLLYNFSWVYLDVNFPI